MDTTNRAIAWPVGPWKDRKEYDAWWSKNVIAFNRLAVTDPAEWERIAQVIEKFHRSLET